MSLTNWIDKGLNDIKNESMFSKYFKGIDMQVIDETYYLLNSEAGIDIVFSNDFFIQSIHLFSGTTDDGKKYLGEIPLGLQFSMSKDIVNDLLGDPNKSGGGYTDIFGHVPNWDKYFFEGHSLHLQYAENMSRINLITIASLSLESYFNIGLQ